MSVSSYKKVDGDMGDGEQSAKRRGHAELPPENSTS
jgi:hypothetical protein